MNKSIIIILFIFICLNSYNIIVKGCGMTTHNTVARRAYNFSSFEGYSKYQEYISDNFDVFDAGAAFPDFGYDCGNLANESEAAHWPPFLRAATTYLLETYKQPWNNDAIRLAVFLMGITSHQVADISWHSIGGIQEGFIRAMAGQDFNGTYSVAHSNADEGGEFELAYNYDLSWLSDKWYVPITDIKNIYHSMNYTRVNDENLLRCNSILYAGAMGVKIGGKFFYPEIAKKSPFLIDHYQDYFNGGLDDMSIWTSYCWPVLMGWMEGGEIGDFCFIQPDPNNDLFKNITHQHRHNLLSKGSIIKETLSKSILRDMKVTKQGNGVTFTLPNTIEKIINQAIDKLKNQEKKFESMIKDYLPQLFKNKQKPIINILHEDDQDKDEDEEQGDYFIENNQKDKKQIKDEEINNNNNNNNFKISDNRVYSKNNFNYKMKHQQQKHISKKLLNINNIKLIEDELENNFTTIYGSNIYSYFGKDIKANDLNGDGFDDIVISSPGFGVPGAMQTGCVYYILSNGTSINGVDDKLSSISTEVDIDQVATGKVCGNETHSKFGWSIEILDFNLDGVLDIVVGAPSSYNADLTYLGIVYIYFGVKSGTNKWSVSNVPSIVMQGGTFHDSIGTVLRIADCNADNNPDLILGSPHSHGGGIQRGMVSIFYSSKDRTVGSIVSVNESDVSQIGFSDYEWFGYEIIVAGNGESSTLLVGSPNFHYIDSPVNIGKITAFPYNVNTHSFDSNPQFTLIGSNPNDKLGYSFNMVNGSLFGLNQVNDVMVLSLPTRGFGDDFDQVGEVVLIDIDQLSGLVEITDVFPLLSIKGTTKYSRFGESILVGKLETTDEFARLFVGAPLWTDSSIDTGPGCVFSFLPSQHLTNDKNVLKQNQINNTPIVIYESSHSIKNYKIISSITSANDYDSSTHSLNNKRKDSRFGFRILLSDFNNDGKNDLIVSADRDSSKLLEGGSINIFQ